MKISYITSQQSVIQASE